MTDQNKEVMTFKLGQTVFNADTLDLKGNCRSYEISEIITTERQQTTDTSTIEVKYMGYRSGGYHHLNGSFFGTLHECIVYRRNLELVNLQTAIQTCEDLSKLIGEWDNLLKVHEPK